MFSGAAWVVEWRTGLCWLSEIGFESRPVLFCEGHNPLRERFTSQTKQPPISTTRVENANYLQYLPLRAFDTVTNALNFSTQDCHVIGSCDVYTTKAAGGDKKLYKNIENDLESQYESMVRQSTSLSPPYRAASDESKASDKDSGRSMRGRSVGIPDISLSWVSPFGSLNKITARRTYAYLIATLNASHPDYDFSHTLRPTDFKKERDLPTVMHKIDSTLQNLRPRQLYLAPPSTHMHVSKSASASAGADLWNPRMWNVIDKEMDLKKCEIYTYDPEEDPFDGEEGAVWSMHYLFFNKVKKRVCYIYIRGLSVISHSPVYAPMYLHRSRFDAQRKASSVSVGEGAGKRASYWLGSKVLQGEVDTESYGDDDDDEMIITEPNDDEVEVPWMDLDDIRSDLADGYYSYDNTDDIDDSFMDEVWKPQPSVRGISEEIGASMDM